MLSSESVSKIFSADPSPVVTPAQLAAAVDYILTEVRSMISSASIAAAAAAPDSSKKLFTSVAELRRVTGLSRERICRILLKHPGRVRTIRENPTSSYARYHTQDFLDLVTSLSKPSKPKKQKNL